MKYEDDIADGNSIVVTQSLSTTFHDLIIQVGTVSTLQIFQVKRAVFCNNLGMLATDRIILDLNFTVRGPTDHGCCFIQFEHLPRNRPVISA